MKTRRFLAYLATIVLSCCFVTGCDDNDEPWIPEQETMFIYVDERTEEEKDGMLGGCGMLSFSLHSFDGYKVVATFSAKDNHSYKIYIPAEGANLELYQDYQDPNYKWYYTPDYMHLNDEQIPLNEEILEKIDKTRYYYEKSNDYINIRFDTQRRIEFTIPENAGKDERIIKVYVTNGENSGIPDVADMIFIQAGK